MKPVRSDGRADYYDSKLALELIYVSSKTERQQEALLLDRAKRKKAELELNVLEKKYVPFDEILDLFGKQCSIIRTRFLAMPNALAHVLCHKTEPGQVHAILYKEVVDILKELTAPRTPEEHEYVESQKRKEKPGGSEASGSGASEEQNSDT